MMASEPIVPNNDRMHRRVRTRVFARSTAMSFVSLGFLLMVIGLIADRWIIHEIKLPQRDNILVGRGLAGLTITNDYGTAVAVSYYEEDVNGQRQDPYCGSNNAPSVFSRYLPTMAQELNTTLPDGVCCGPDQMFAATRDDDRNNWCHMRRSILGTAIAATIVAGCAILATSAFCCARGNSHLVPFISLALISAALGLASSVVLAVWMRREDDDQDNRGIAAEDNVRSGLSVVAFVVGWCLTGVGALAELFACCSIKEIEPPLMQEMPYVLAHQGALPAYSPYGQPSGGKPQNYGTGADYGTGAGAGVTPPGNAGPGHTTEAMAV
eukprot:TRINITY_DN8104_c0_g1_i2.p1 TRINITY_DN8104_c0_g1~~TRINITY_DN8104_c0_g1_i2.p1  ORF type:complete len:325 (+),score=57.57 TRINITY_DN8104_c0_g1_i2:114-1088(+)